MRTPPICDTAVQLAGQRERRRKREVEDLSHLHRARCCRILTSVTANCGLPIWRPLSFTSAAKPTIGSGGIGANARWSTQGAILTSSSLRNTDYLSPIACFTPSNINSMPYVVSRRPGTSDMSVSHKGPMSEHHRRLNFRTAAETLQS